MNNLELQLCDSIFVHRKTQCALHAELNATVLGRENLSSSHFADHNESLTSRSFWIPKAQSFILSLHLDFHESTTHVCDNGKAAADVVTDSVGTAELWSELGYEVCQLAVTQDDSTFGNKTFVIEMEMRCFDYHDDFTFDCPPDIQLARLASVRINCQLKHASTVSAQASIPPDHAPNLDPLHPQSFDRPPSDGLTLPHAPDETFGGTGTCGQTSHTTHRSSPGVMVVSTAFRETKKSGPYPLNDEVLVRLIDAFLRRGICPDAMSPSLSTSIVRECRKLSLCEFAPNIFSRAYSQNFEEQAIFIRGLADILASFEATYSRSATQPDALGANGADDVKNNGHRATRELFRKNLWMTLARGLRNGKSARRLSPLYPTRSVLSGKYSGQQKSIGASMVIQNSESGDIWKSSAKTQDEEVNGEIPLAIQYSLHAERSSRLDSSNESPIPAVTSMWNDDLEDAMMSGYHDVGSVDEGQPRRNTCDLLHEAESLSGQLDERRSRTCSFSPESDVSMLTALSRKVTHVVEQAHAVKASGVIGSSSSLTQNVIRMHPPWTNAKVRANVHSPNYDKRGASSQESAASQWVGNIFDKVPPATPDPSSCCSDRCTVLDINCKTAITDHELISVFQDAIYDSAEEENIFDFPMTTSSESERLTDSSLSDVLGNDHLLWHMWKRRASVAPRGEADIEDMKTLYESDPDMKLFSKDWSMGNSDMESSSNGDPMLQELPSQLRKSSTSASPMSDRRSYFAPSRSSSSSSSPVQTPAEPKLQRRGSIMKRFSWGGRSQPMESAGLNMTSLNGRDFEVKRRRTMEDYAAMEKETNSDTSHEMLF